MLDFYREYAPLEWVPQPVAQMPPAPKVPQAVALFTVELILALPWGHHAELMAKVKDHATRRWYMQAALEHGWSRSILVMQIETAAHQRQDLQTSLPSIEQIEAELQGLDEAAHPSSSSNI